MTREFYRLDMEFVNGYGMSYIAEDWTEIIPTIKKHDHEGCTFTVTRVVEEDETETVRNLYEAGNEQSQNLPDDELIQSYVDRAWKIARYDGEDDHEDFRSLFREIIEEAKITEEMNSELQKKLSELLNRFSAENGSGTPDFLLAEYLIMCLSTYDNTVQARELWYGRNPVKLVTGEGQSK